MSLDVAKKNFRMMEVFTGNTTCKNKKHSAMDDEAKIQIKIKNSNLEFYKYVRHKFPSPFRRWTER